MANLKDLKARINSVKSTQKITRAMKMVSASKLRKAKEKAEAAAPYADRMARMLSTLAANVSTDSAPKLLIGNNKDDRHLLIIISSDRGLCGAFNTHLVKTVKQEINKLQSQGKTPQLFCIGKKSYEQLKWDFNHLIVDHIEGISKKSNISFSDASEQSDKIINMFENNKFDTCTIYYNKFISAISQQPTSQQLIPLNIENNEQPSDSIYEYEPGEEIILSELLPKNIAVQIFHAFLENSASEHGARMSSMDNATRNAGEMINKLNLIYNRTRQAAITSELIEIISGAEAV